MWPPKPHENLANRGSNVMPKRARIYVLAGVNGSGKSSIGGAMLREKGIEFYNPDVATRELLSDRTLSPEQANSLAWSLGVKRLERSMSEHTNFAFETTLGGNTIPHLLQQAAIQGIEIHIWYAGLSSPELHIERVKARVRKGGHDIPEADIRRRYENSRKNLIALLPHLTALRVYDNSIDADPARGKRPKPVLLLHINRRKLQSYCPLRKAPDWAKPIVAAALNCKK